jgi:MoxR-like ATPase
MHYLATTMASVSVTSMIEEAKAEIEKGVIGQKDFINSLLIVLACGGHALIEGVPGLAKTRAVNLLAKVSGCAFKRIQFTPDLLPADITGSRIYNQSTLQFEVRKGPLFAEFILADEINRAPARVQSALLEAMQERQITIGDVTHQLPSPFFVFATQNPVEQEGTYPLPEAQMDRFLFHLYVDYPSPKEEEDVIAMVIDEKQLPDVKQVLNPELILKLQEAVRTVHMERKILEYIQSIVTATRTPDGAGDEFKDAIELGVSPRAGISMAQAARARSLMAGRSSVYPEDVKAVAHDCLRHRIMLTYSAKAKDITANQIITSILEKTKVP